MSYRILTVSNSRWGEGWKYGDIVEMDFEAARVPLQKHEIEPVEEFKKEVVAEVKEEKKEEPTGEFVCVVCQKVCKNKLGLTSHMRSHK